MQKITQCQREDKILKVCPSPKWWQVLELFFKTTRFKICKHCNKYYLGNLEKNWASFYYNFGSPWLVPMFRYRSLQVETSLEERSLGWSDAAPVTHNFRMISFLNSRSNRAHSRTITWQRLKIKGGSPGLVGMGRGSRSEGYGFESRHCILDGHFFTCICRKNCNVCLKRPKINEKEAVVGPFFFKKD